MSLRMRALGSFMFHIIILWYINSFSLGYTTKFQNEIDKPALLAFKEAVTLDPHGIFNSWNNSVHYCQWRGVSCSTKHRERVTVLDLTSSALVGSLSPRIGNLSFLRAIHLNQNDFYGKIPSELGQLHRLRILDLANNSFHGEVPTNLTSCINLRYIDLIGDNLTGKFPIHLTSLPKLEVLNLAKNNFQGKLPPSIGNLSYLIELSLREASLEGSIPEELGQLTRLQFLQMSENNLTGTIPSSIYNISTLTMFAVAKNNLEGSLPANVGFMLPNLQELYMGENRLSGAIPISLSNASHLQIISFAFNRFTGKVPWELGRLVNLSWIGLGANMLGTKEGNNLNFISHLTNCTKLEKLFVGDNMLKGKLPNSVANLSTQIKYLSLGVNQIYGTIPSGIGNLVNLNLLDMQYLMLAGNVPSSIGTLQKLRQLYIPGNQLIGQIPISFANLSNLYDLDLGQNNLSGNIPISLSYSQKLQILDLSQNDLSGQIPPSIFSLPSALSINLSCNSLSGSFLREAVNLKQLESLDVSKNRLSGGISRTIGSFVSLVSLHMNGNLFNGSIPQELESLRGLDELDLSQNNLSGVIPDYLGELPFLKRLNLSFNDLEGPVSEIGIFRNVSAISLVGNKKLCGGISELKLQACTRRASKKGRTFFALKVVIPIIAVSICLTLLASFVIIRYRRTKSKEKPSTSFNPEHMKISYGELFRATDNFCNANLLGIGSYGSVYKGILHQSETIIAVKVLNLHQRGALKSFVSECRAMKRIRHRNLLKILSVCSSVDYQGNEFKAVIYEFMPNGNLENWLHPNQIGRRGHEQGSLSVIQRLNIAIDIAFALEYLHNHCQTQIIHGDLKPNNVLLDENMVAHVGDFGLAKVLSNITSGSLDDQSSSVIIKGSIGYVAPEYGMGEPVSPSGDTYSYGVLLLELFTGKRPTDDIFKEGLNIHKHTRMALPNQVVDIVDPQMMQVQQLEEMTERTQDCLIQLLEVGLSCSVETPRERMAISEVVRKLHSIKNLYEA